MSHELTQLGPDLHVSPLCLGGNVFGWTADEPTSHHVLDAYVDAGGNFIDTSDSYSFWADGNSGGESETIIGSWLSGRRDRDSLVIATKVSQHPQFEGLAPSTIRGAIDQSLRRLGIEHVDLYYAHFDDVDTPMEQTIETMSALVDAGKVRALGISNYTPDRIREWLRICDEGGFHRPVALQPQYSLVERAIENDLLPLAQGEKLGVMPYYALARGFLTGKYAKRADIDSPRSTAAAAYLDDRGRAVLDTLTEVADNHGAHPASVAIAWLLAQPGVTAPIASARTLDQLGPLLDGAELALTDLELNRLTEASSAC